LVVGNENTAKEEQEGNVNELEELIKKL